MRRRVLAVGLAALMVALGFTACAKKPSQADVDTPQAQVDEQLDVPTVGEPEVSQRSTVLYYQDEGGYLVPVMRKVPWVEGVAKAALSYLVSSEENDFDAARMGLRTTIPANTTIDLDIKEEMATVSLSKEAMSCEDAASETVMVEAISSTLLEFPTISQVQITIDGEKVKALKHGTDVSKAITKQDINLESVASGVGTNGSTRVRLYFESDAADTMIPITRTVFSNNDVETAIVELLKGPSKNSGLANTLPADCALISVSRKNGVLSINFTKSFLDVLDNDDGGNAAMKSLVLTCQQFPDVKEVKVLVDGEMFDLGAQTMSTQYVNTEEDILGSIVYTNAGVEELPD